jgi:hypothetical protein
MLAGVPVDVHDYDVVIFEECGQLVGVIVGFDLTRFAYFDEAKCGCEYLDLILAALIDNGAAERSPMFGTAGRKGNFLILDQCDPGAGIPVYALRAPNKTLIKVGGCLSEGHGETPCQR